MSGGELSQLRHARELGRLAELRQPAGGRREARGPAQVGELVLDRAGALERAGRVDQHGRQVVGDRGLEAHVGIDEDGERGEHHDHAHHALERRPADGPQDPPAAEADREQRGRRADGVADRHGHRRPGGGADRDDGGQDRPRARGVDEPERGADAETADEPVAAGARAVAGERRQPALDAVGEPRREQQRAEAEQHQHGDRAQGAAAQADAVDQLGDPDDRDRERDGEAEHDPERPPPPAGGAGRQQRRQDRQHARRERRAGAGDHGEEHEERHDETVRSAVLRAAYVG